MSNSRGGAHLGRGRWRARWGADLKRRGKAPRQRQGARHKRRRAILERAGIDAAPGAATAALGLASVLGTLFRRRGRS